MRFFSLVNRCSFSFAALLICSLFFSCAAGTAAGVLGILFYAIFGLVVGWTGALVLCVVSFVLDELLLNRLLGPIKYRKSIWIWLAVYCILGWVIGAFMYPGNSLFQVSGLIAAGIYIVLFQSFIGLNQHRLAKMQAIAEME